MNQKTFTLAGLVSAFGTASPMRHDAPQGEATRGIPARLCRWMFLLPLLLLELSLSAAILPSSPTTLWTAFPYRKIITVDYLADQQTGSEEGDIVGTNGLPAVYMAYNPGSNATNGTLGFRVRLGKDASPDGFKGVFHIAIDGNNDGVLDVFLSVDNSGSPDAIRIFPAGTGLNISPDTTTIDSQHPFITYGVGTSNYNWTNVSAAIDPAVTNSTIPNPTNIDGASGPGETDYFLSYFVPFSDVVSALASVGITGITTNSGLRYLASTATQPNSLNQDIGGLKGGISNPTNYNDLDILTPPVDVFGHGPAPVAVNDVASTAINTPVTIAVLANDSSPLGLNLIVTNVSGVSTGTVTIVNQTNVLYTPPANFLGTATFTYTNEDEIGGRASATVTVNVAQPASADVQVTKSGPASVLAAGTVSYTITVTNVGPSPATNVVVVDPLPATASFVNASGGGVLGGGNTVTWPGIVLAANQSTSYTVTVTAPANGVITNRASATSSTPDPNATNNSGSNATARVTTTVTPQADVAVLVSAPANVLAGANFTYTILLTNRGPSVATNAIATNLLPASVAFVSASGSGANNGGQVTWPAVTLASGAGVTYTVTVTAPGSGSLTNVARGGSVTPDPDLTNNDGSSVSAIAVTSVTPQADIAVAKSGPATILATSNITYLILVTNFGPSAASEITVSDALPTNVTFVSATGGGLLSGSTVTWSGLSLAAGASTGLGVTVQAPAAGSFTNVVSASSSIADPNAGNNDGSSAASRVATTVTPQADVIVTVTGPATVLAGANYSYTVTASNAGPSTASNVAVTNFLPTGVTFVSATSGGSVSGSLVTWPSASLNANGAITYTVTVTAPGAGVLTNVAAGAATTLDPDLNNNNGTAAGAVVVTAVTPQADVSVTKSGPATVSASATFSYTITVANNGPSTASNVVAVDTLPANLTYVSASASGSFAAGTVTWPGITLLAGASTNFTITVTAPTSGGFTNSASATSSTGDPDGTNNDGSNSGARVATAVTEQADVIVTVSGPANVLAGASYSYTVTVSNAGPSAATNILATNTLPASATFVSASAGGSAAGSVVTWPGFNLASGEATNLIVNVTAPGAGPLTNVASGLALTPDPDLTNNNGSASSAVAVTTVTPQADLVVAKTGPSSAQAGANFSYTITVTNFGPSTATAVSVSDVFPSGLTFVSASGAGVLSAGNVSWTGLTLASGAGASFTVTATSAEGRVVTNRALATSDVADPNTANNDGSNEGAIVTTTINSKADVIVTVTGPSSVTAASSYSYTVTVSNAGPSTATAVTVSNILPATVTFVSATGAGTNNGGIVTWPGIDLAANGSTSYVVNVTAPATGSLTNRAAGTSATTDPDLTNNDGSSETAIVITTVTEQADLAVFKSGPAVANAAQQVTYSIVVTNAGPSVATSVNIIDSLSNATFVSASSGGANVANLVMWTVLSLQAGTATNLTVTVQAPASGSMSDVAEAHSPVVDPDLSNNSGSNATAQVVTTIVPKADLAVAKTGPASVNAGGAITYTISVTNFGPSDAAEIAAIDTLPAALTFVSASSGGLIGGDHVVRWPTFALNAGSSTNFTVTVTAPAEGSFVNTASATGNVDDPDLSNNSGSNNGARVTTTVTPQADVAVTVTGPTSVLATSNLTYTILVTNHGPSTASNVVITDLFATNCVFVSASGSGSNNNGVVTWPAFNLPAGGSTSFTLTVKAPVSGSLTNVASGSATTADPDLSNNNGSAPAAVVVTTIAPVADIAVAKSGPANVGAASNVTYTVYATNLGPSIATNVVVVDHLPANVIFVSANGSGSLDSSYNVVWPAVVLPPGGAVVFSVTVTAPASGTVTNSASATSDAFDPNTANNDGSGSGSRVTTLVITPAQFGVIAAPAAFNPQTGLYEQKVVVTNTGLSTVPAVRLNVSGLRTNVFLRNATGTNEGVPYVQYNAPLNPAQSVTFLLEFYVADRRPITNALYLAEGVMPTATATNLGAGTAIRRVFLDHRDSSNPRVVVEFASVVGKTYTIIYSDDMTTWKAATPAVTASGTATQWYDDGPPKTQSRPASITSRIYRVIVAP